MSDRRILVASAHFPHDPIRKVTGAEKRLGSFLDGLKALGTLDCVFFVGPQIDVSPGSVAAYRDRLAEHFRADLDLTLVTREPPPPPGSRWAAYGAPVLNGFRSSRFCWASGPRQREAVRAALDRRPDLLFVHRLASFAPLIPAARDLPPICFDLDDIEHRAFLRSIPHPPAWRGKGLYYLQVPAIWWAERRAASRADLTFVCSAADRRYLEKVTRTDGIRVVPNAVDIPAVRPPAAEPTALFLGNLSYRPNLNAAILLVEEIWPRVRTLVPGARLVIAGPCPEAVAAEHRNRPGITFPGFVSDLDELYARTRVVCAPILAGGGTRLKIIEAAAHGRPVVSTSLGAEGIDLSDGQEILLRDEWEGFARAVADLMRDDAAAERIGAAAHRAIREAHERARIVEEIRRMAMSLLATPGPRPTAG